MQILLSRPGRQSLEPSHTVRPAKMKTRATPMPPNPKFNSKIRIPARFRSPPKTAPGNSALLCSFTLRALIPTLFPTPFSAQKCTNWTAWQITRCFPDSEAGRRISIKKNQIEIKQKQGFCRRPILSSCYTASHAQNGPFLRPVSLPKPRKCWKYLELQNRLLFCGFT